MSFVGSVGFAMECSRLEKVFETVYGKKYSYLYVFWKAISRAFRCHFLVDTALRINLISILAWINVSGSNKRISKICISKIKICQRAFDGCKSKTTKNHEHARREAGNPSCADVLVGENVNVLHSREELLSNSNNKQ